MKDNNEWAKRITQYHHSEWRMPDCTVKVWLINLSPQILLKIKPMPKFMPHQMLRCSHGKKNWTIWKLQVCLQNVLNFFFQFMCRKKNTEFKLPIYPNKWSTTLLLKILRKIYCSEWKLSYCWTGKQQKPAFNKIIEYLQHRCKKQSIFRFSTNILLTLQHRVLSALWVAAPVMAERLHHSNLI